MLLIHPEIVCNGDYSGENYGFRTKYIVKVTYPVTESDPDMISEFYEAVKNIKSDNTAAISVTLADIEQPQTDDDDDTQNTDLPVTPPSTIRISKQLQNSTNTDTSPYTDKYGTIAYVLYADEAFDLYTAGANNTYTVSASAVKNEDTGKYEIAVDALTTYTVKSGIAFTVKENLTEEQLGNMLPLDPPTGELTRTPEAGKLSTFDFTNREINGNVEIVKVDDHGYAVKGAEFTLTETTTNKKYSGSTNDNGHCTFSPIPYGTYTVEETDVPKGYSAGTISPISFTLDDDHKTVTVNATNERTAATIQLNKYVGIAEADIKNAAHMPATFGSEGDFVLQRTTDGTSWEEVTKDIYGYDIPTVITNGKIVAEVPAKDPRGNVYTYRFKEKIPEGYYDPRTGAGAGDEVYSAEKTLMNGDDVATDIVQVDLENRRKVNIRGTKNFINITSTGGTSNDTSKKTTATLWSYTGDNAPTSADGLTQVGDSKDISQNTYATWSVPLYGPQGKIHYLLKEEQVDGYVFDRADNAGSNTTAVKIVTIDGERYVEIMPNKPGATTSTFTTRLYNYENVIPVIIIKRDYYTETQQMEGFSFSVYTDRNKTTLATDAKTGDDITNIPFNVRSGNNYNGVVVFLEPGKIYYFDEDNQESLPDGWRFNSLSNDGVIDLTEISQPGLTNQSTKRLTRYIYNNQDPIIWINKSSSTGGAVSGSKFAVYKKLANGTYKKVTDITTTNANSGVTLPPLPNGESYYVAETDVPDGYINPNSEQGAALYNGLTNNDNESPNYYPYTYTYNSTLDLTLVEVTVEDQPKKGKNPNVCTFNFKNIPNKGNLRVKKLIDGEETNVIGFSITVTGSDGTVKTEQSGPHGITMFNDLPVYNTNFEKITYTVTEILTEEQEEKYYKYFDGQSAQLDLGEIPYNTFTTTFKDLNGDDLVVDNHTKIELDVNKLWFNSWQHGRGGLDFPLPGTEIGLYIKQEDGSWKLAQVQTTDNSGSAAFSGLEREKDYALVELSSPNEKLFPWQNGWKNVPASKEIGSVISASDISNYNVLTYTAAQIAAGNSPYSVGDLFNANHWVQFHITKWLDRISNRNLTPGEFNPSETDVNGNPLYPRLDNAVFSLYRYILQDGQDSVVFDRDTWTLLGSYSTGTAYDLDGNRIPGEFLTTVDDDINNNYVYMLVEESTGPNTGAVINPNFQYTFWQSHSHSAVTCTVDGAVVRHNNYVMDAVNHDDILNSLVTGPGPAEIYLASFRLSKWRDSFDDDGKRKQEYEPLSRAVFELRLPDGQVISTLISGKEGFANYALAQSGVFQLIMSEADGETVYTLREYEAPEDKAKTYDVTDYVEVFEQNGCRIYAVRLNLFETSAPDGYGYQTEGYETYLGFVDQTPAETVNATYWYFNDLYFIKTTDTVALAEEQNGRYYYLTDTTNAQGTVLTNSSDGQLRIVDYPMTNTPVTVHKFGYAPSADTLGKDSAQLHAAGVGTMLEGIEMVLECRKENGSWNRWDYMNNTWGDGADGAFETNAAGAFMFPHGLPMGTYRIYETGLGNFADTYEMAYPNGDNARIFTVGGAKLDIYMANPEKLDLTLIKEGMDGSSLTGAQFTLTGKGTGAKTYNATTGEGGSVVIQNIQTGTYVLSETMAGYSTEYLKACLKSVDSSLVALAGSGAFIGYTYDKVQSKDDEDDANLVTDQDVIIKTVSQEKMLRTVDGAYTLSLTIRNPKLTSLTLKKTAEQPPASALSGAAFAVYYQEPFNKEQDGFGTTADSVAVTPFNPDNTTGWTRVNSYSTNSSGMISPGALQNRAPGVYAFYETSAPTGYDILNDKNGNRIIYYAVVTGGLNVTVTGLPETAEINKVDGTGTTTVQTLWTSDDGTVVEVAAINREKINLYASKIGNYGELADNVRNWSVTLNVYSDADATELVGTVTLTKNAAGPVQFKTSSSNNAPAAWFSQNTTYYIKEEVNSTNPAQAKDNFTLSGIKLGDTPLTETAEGSGIYSFKTGAYGAEQEDATLTASNDWLRGRITLRKYDVEDTNHTNPLSGAEFEVWYKADPDDENSWTKIEGVDVPEQLIDGQGTGVYTADVPLFEAGPVDYRIVETKAPNGGYLDPDENCFVPVTLSLEHNVKGLEDNLRLTNEKGRTLKIVKYDNIREDSPDTVGENEAEFTVYHYLDETGKWAIAKGDIATDGSGEVSYVTEPGDTYAVAETRHKTTYLGLEGFYMPDGTKLDPQTITLTDDSQVEAYVVGELTGALTLNAYNIPRISPTIVKVDVGGYPEGVQATMQYSIYDVTDVAAFADADAVTDAVVETYLAGHVEPVFNGETATEYGTSGTSGTWESSVDAKCWNPTRTYLLVEDSISARDGVTYDTLNKDDSRVVWYKMITPVANPDRENPPVYELRNICGTADSKLTKTVDVTSMDSLLKADDAGRDVTYTIKPEVTTVNQPLKSFTLTDSGLVFYDKEDQKLTHEYKITGITVGAASYSNTETQTFDTEKFGKITDLTISAEVTFLKADGVTQTGEAYSIPDISEDKEVPADAIPADAAGFAVSYFTSDIVTATKGVYALGRGFEVVGETKLTANVAKQVDGTKDSPVVEIAKFDNEAKTVLAYPKWKNNGSATDDVTIERLVKAVTTVEGIKLPQISVDKTSEPATLVKADDYVLYTITVKNTGTPAEVFKDPVVLDILPTGVTFVEDADHPVTIGTGSAGEEFTAAPVETFVGSSTLEIHEPGADVEYGPSETAIVFRLQGELKPGSSMQIAFYAQVSKSIAAYGNKVENDVFLSSSAESWHTAKNPNGYAYQVSDGVYAKTLKPETTALDTMEGGPNTGYAPRKLGGLTSELATYLDEKFVWVSQWKTLTVDDDAKVTLRKSVQGDRDKAFSDQDTFLGSATRSNFEKPESAVPADQPGGDQGWVNWKLSVNNGDPAEDRTYLAIADYIPKVGDGRKTVWNTVMHSILGIQNNGVTVPANKYTLYYYTGTIQEAPAAVESALTKSSAGVPACFDWTAPGNGWVSAASVTSYEQLVQVTAFLIRFDPSIVLEHNSSLITVYHTTVANMTDDTEFYRDYAFENAVNSFFVGCKETSKIQESNQVSVTLQDKPVSVEGDLWIDEDWDNTQQVGNRRDYSAYKMVQKLIDAISFNIKDNRTGGGTSYDDKGGTYENHGYGESIKHFTFEDLGAGHQVRNPLYDSANDNRLRPAALKGDDPYNYTLNAQLNTDSILDVFKLTGLGTGHYMSDDPDTATNSDANVLDDNFYETALSTQFTTHPFYVRYSKAVDKSKDIGFRMMRGLEITKVAADNPGMKLEGAKFQMFGPYDDEEGNKNSNNTVAKAYSDSASPLTFNLVEGVYVWKEDGTGTENTLVTDANGKIKVTGLNWWKEYVVRETVAVDGFEIEGATATADSSYTMIEYLGDGKWVLKLPNPDKEDGTDKVTVKNPRNVETQLKARKYFKTYSDKEFTFQFDLTMTGVTDLGGNASTTLEALNSELLAHDEDDPIQTISITVKDGTGDGTGTNAVKDQLFDKLTLCGEGIYTFNIHEQVTTNAGMVFDTTDKTATVTVTWDEDEKKLVASDPVYTGNTVTDDDAACFINTYDAQGNVVFNAKKEFTHGTITAGQFTFTLTEYNKTYTQVLNGGVSQRKSCDETGAVAFDPVEYHCVNLGDHYYQIEEVLPSGATADNNYIVDGIRYDPTKYQIKVSVSDGMNGSLVVVKDPKPAEGAPDAVFTNEQLGKLQITKKATLNGQSTNTEKIDDTYSFTVASVDGKVIRRVELTVDHGQSDTVVIPDLPIGQYVITENLTEDQQKLGITVTPANATVTTSPDSTLPDDAKAEFTNNRNIGDLKIQKVVQGTEDKMKTFTFRIALTKPQGLEFEESYPAVLTNAEGIATPPQQVDVRQPVVVTLKADETYEIKDLPSGTTYTVTEVPAAGYTSDKENDQAGGSIPVGNVSTVVFTNTYRAVGSIDLSGVKTWDNTLKGDDFTFKLTEVDADGKPLTTADGDPVYEDTATNTADGGFAFDTIEYVMDIAGADHRDDTGVHYYKVEEVKDGDWRDDTTDTALEHNGDTCLDNVSYIITVTVTDNQDGTLEAVSDKTPEDIAFYNAVPSILKAVNKDSHAELYGYNQIFTYDILAYVPQDAVQIVITDTARAGIVFVSAQDEVLVADMGEVTPEKADYNANGSLLVAEGTPITSGTVQIDSKSLSVTLDTTQLQGHHVKVTFRGAIDNTVVKDLGSYEANKEHFEDNGLLVSSIVDVPGVANTAQYTITADNNHNYGTIPSNGVTVTPPPTRLDVSKDWVKVIDGEEKKLDWPTEIDENGNKVKLPVTFTLYREDDPENPFVLEDGTPTVLVLPVTQEVVDEEGNTSTEEKITGSFINLPVFLKDAEDPASKPWAYFVKETVPAGYEAKGMEITDNTATEEDEADYVYKAVNTSTEEPKIAKTVNRDVHADLASYDQIFTYDIIAYVTLDADVTTITDTLIDALEFVPDTPITVVDLGTTVNYTAGSAGSFAAEGTPLDADVTQTKVTTEGQVLTVAIGRSQTLRGHYVKVNFQAKLNNNVVGDLTSYEAAKESVTANGLVISEIASHEGVPNKASYTIEANNGHTYRSESNTVTVTPTETSINVRKVWTTDEEDEVIAWPEGVTVVVTLMDNGKATDRTVTLNAANPTGTFANIPVWKTTDASGKTITPLHVYTVEETSVTGVPVWYETKITGNAADGFTVTNSMLPGGNVVAPAGKKYYKNGILKDNLFTFTVTSDDTGDVVSTGHSTADGNIVFSQIVYKQSDLGNEKQKYFYYTIREDIPEGANASNGYTLDDVTYDPAEIKFRVNVTRLENGQLDTEIDYMGHKVEFTNVNEHETGITPTGKKSYKDGKLTDGAFTFTIKDAAGNTVSTGTSKADGTIEFTEIRYSASDLDGAKEKTFTYKVTEDLPSGATSSNKYTVGGVKYDPSEKTLTIKVTMDDNGVLSASQTTDASKLVFENSKVPDNPPGKTVKTGDDTPIASWWILLFIAVAAAAGSGFVIRRRRRS